MEDFNAQHVTDTPWALAVTSGVLPKVVGSLCRTAAAKVPGFNVLDVTHALWALAVISGGPI